MKVEITYPEVKNVYRPDIVRVFGLCFLFAACAAGIVNYCVGGKPWSIVSAWGLWFVWSFCINRDLIEYNRISQGAKLLVYTCITQILIELCLAPVWAGLVVPIEGFGSLIVIGVLFFSNISKQKQNLMPLLWLVFAALVAVVSSLFGWPSFNWAFLVLGAIALAILIASIVILKRDMLLELKKRFHMV